MKKAVSRWGLRTAYKKGFKEGSKFWQISFYLILIGKVLKFINSKAEPETIDQYDLAPGEYKVVVTENDPKKKK